MNILMRIVFTILLLGVALFAKDVGRVTAINGDAFLLRENQKIALTLGTELQIQDSIVTKENAKVQIVFKDNTIVTIGKNAKFSIDAYLYDESKESSLQFGLLQGAMRTITGKIGKIAPQKFKVKIKTATIGIRGTNFTIVQREDNLGSVYCTYGEISVSFNERESRVKEGFYANIMPTSVEVKAFSAKELLLLDKDNFGVSTKEKSSNTPSKELHTLSKALQETEIDTTKELEPSSIVTKELANKVQDAKQTNDKEEQEHSYYPDDNTPDTEIVPDTEDNTPQNTTDIAKMVGNFVTNENTIEYVPSNLNINFSPLDTFPLMSLYVTSSSGVVELWSFKLGSLLSAVSKESFVAEIASATLSSFGADDASLNARLVSGTLVARNDDLAQEDGMTWGIWNASLLYDNTNGKNQSHQLKGLWVAGDQVTDTDIITSLQGSAVQYDGIYKAIEYTTESYINGEASMVVNFGEDSAILNISYGTGRLFHLYLVEGGLSGYQEAGGYSNAMFYGEEGELIGGNFSTIQESSADNFELKGVYELALSESLAENLSSIYSGWMMRYYANDYNDFVRYELDANHEFLQSNSYITLNKLVNSEKYFDYWELKFAKTPTNFISKEEFSVNLESVYMLPAAGSTSKNAKLIYGELKATGDDLAKDDYMTWGYWNASLSYETDAGTESNAVSGYWQAGEATPVSVVDAITASDVSYTGVYRGVDFTQNNSIINGAANLNVDFGADSAVLDIDYASGRTFNMMISGNVLAGSIQGSEGEAYGTFYGPNADSVGGNFATRTLNGTNEIQGVYQVSKLP